MRNFQKSGKLRHIMQSKFFLILLAIVILFSFYNIFNFMGKMEETSKNKEIVQNKIAELEKSKGELNSEINKLKTENGIEENIREKFGLAKEGENMILVIDDKNSVDAQKKTDSGGFFSFFKNLFK